VTLKRNLSIAVAIGSIVIGGLVLSTLIGRPARLVDLLGLFASGFGAGASLVAGLRQARPSAASVVDTATAEQ
jgi:hypothetical protein